MQSNNGLWTEGLAGTIPDASEHIDIFRGEEIRTWARNLNVTEDELLCAIRSVGNKIENVKRYLNLSNK